MAREVRTFGEYTLDVSAERLLRGEHPVLLQRKPLRLLVLLTSRPGTVVTREEIIRALWRPNETVDFEQGLRFAVRQVRAALGEGRDRPMYVETRHGVGYVFKCAVSRKFLEAESPQLVQPLEPAASLLDCPLSEKLEPAGSLPSSTIAPTSFPEPTRARMQCWSIVSAAAVCTLVAFVATALWRANRKPISLAVMPMLNLTRSGTYNDLGDDFTAAISGRIRSLAGRQIHVVEADLADLPREQTRNPLAAAEALKTDYALSTTLEKAPVGSGLQLTLQIYKAGRDDAMWTSHYTADETHLMAAVDDLSTQAIRALPVQLKPELHPAVYISPSREAELAYVRGRREFAERTQNEMNAALDDFKAAIRLDPSYAAAHAMLAVSYEHLGSYGWIPQADARKRADEEVEAALLLNPKLSEGLAARGYSRWFYHWNWKGADQDFTDAIRADSQNVDARHWYALLLAAEGRNNEAEQQMELALELQPRSKVLRTNRGWLKYFVGEPEKAAIEMETVLRDDTHLTSARVKLWATYSLEHRYDDAYRQLKVLSEENLSEEVRDALDQTYKSKGYAVAVKQWSQQQSEATRGNTLLRAQLAEASDDNESAVQILITAAQDHDGWLLFAFRDPALHSAVDDPRFKRSVEAMGLSFGQ